MAYFGSDSRRTCHAEIYKGWSESGMAKMLRPYAPQNVVGDLKNNNEFYLGDEADYRNGEFQLKRARDRRLFARMTVRNHRHYFDISQSDGNWHSYPVDYTIGSKFEQAYATKLPNGEIHVFPIQYNVQHKQWINFWKVIDGPGSERRTRAPWERLDVSTSSLNLRQAIPASCAMPRAGVLTSITWNSRSPESIGEMCHGPSGGHVIENE
jgi:hypothetical protein